MSYEKKAIGAGLGYAVAGPVGAVAGVALAGADDGDDGDDGDSASDIPFGVYVKAGHDDDEVRRRWTLRFLSDVPSSSCATLRLLTDAGQRVRGRSPFADDDGAFVASADIHDGQCTLDVPLSAMVYDSPKNISLEVSVSVTRGGRLESVGNAILDAELPPP